MTKLLRVRCMILKDYLINYDPMEDYKDGALVITRYYTSEHEADIFETRDETTFIETYGECFYEGRVMFSRKWVDLDETKIPKGMINSSTFYDDINDDDWNAWDTYVNDDDD